MKKWIVIALFGLLASAVFAQPPAPDPWMGDPQGMRRERIHERIEAMRIWKLTEALNLDGDRAAVFFPRYRQHLAIVDSLELKRIKTIEAIQAGIDADSTMDYKASVATVLDISHEVVEQQAKFLKQNQDLLNEREQAAFILFEHRFHQRLRDVMRDLRMDQPPPFPPRGGPGGDKPDRSKKSR